MTTRRWMILIAVVASALASGTFLERRSRFLVLARQNEPLARFFGRRQRFYLSNGTAAIDASNFDASGTMKPEAVARAESLRAHYAGLVAKYRYAADHPWVHVEPDPPAPNPGHPAIEPGCGSRLERFVDFDHDGHRSFRLLPSPVARRR